ncbi:MAG: DUF4321 domain-containing protein [Candidatus Omnitrophica bacterium]|nr:DUF4321 domain-containing protein [Candidatus Omnitrophota bacterium]
MKHSIVFLIFILVIGTLIGTTVGELLGLLVGEGTKMHSFFNLGLTPSFSPTTLNLIIMSITFGIKAKITLCGVLGMLLCAVFAIRKL